MSDSSEPDIGDESQSDVDEGPITQIDLTSNSDMSGSEDDEPPKKKKLLKKKDLEEENDENEIEDDGDPNFEDVDDDDTDFRGKEKFDKSIHLPVLNPFALIKNKDIRKKMFKKMVSQKKRTRKAERKQRKEEGGKRSTGHTIESLREKDHTTVETLEGSDNEELRKELEIDDFSHYYANLYTPKVLITFADNPLTKTRKFGKELSRIIPNSLSKVRNRSSIKKMVKAAQTEGFTDLVVINEDHRQPNGMLVIHLPDGPTAYFKLSNVKITKEMKRNYREMTTHRPEVILTNFTTRLGLNIGRMFGALFHHDPEFKGRRAVTFHNQRDYIFFRHHRYEFTKDGRRAKLRELGPRFTLKLQSLQEGTFDTKCGDFEWMITNKRHAMEGRRKFFL